MTTIRPLALALLLAAPIGAAAQTAAPREPKMTAEQRAEKFTASIEQSVGRLTPEQREKIRAINLETAQEMDEHRQEARKQRVAMRKSHLDRDSEIQAVLTPEQREKYNANKAERQDRMQTRKAAWKDARRAGRTHGKHQQGAPADSSRN